MSIPRGKQNLRIFIGGCHDKKFDPFLPKLQELYGKIKSIYL